MNENHRAYLGLVSNHTRYPDRDSNKLEISIGGLDRRAKDDLPVGRKVSVVVPPWKNGLGPSGQAALRLSNPELQDAIKETIDLLRYHNKNVQPHQEDLHSLLDALIEEQKRRAVGNV